MVILIDKGLPDGGTSRFVHNNHPIALVLFSRNTGDSYRQRGFLLRRKTLLGLDQVSQDAVLVIHPCQNQGIGILFHIVGIESQGQILLSSQLTPLIAPFAVFQPLDFFKIRSRRKLYFKISVFSGTVQQDFFPFGNIISAILRFYCGKADKVPIVIGGKESGSQTTVGKNVLLRIRQKPDSRQTVLESQIQGNPSGHLGTATGGIIPVTKGLQAIFTALKRPWVDFGIDFPDRCLQLHSRGSQSQLRLCLSEQIIEAPCPNPLTGKQQKKSRYPC